MKPCEEWAMKLEAELGKHRSAKSNALDEEVRERVFVRERYTHTHTHTSDDC